MLERAVKLLKDMDEFAQSRFRLEARYRHVLVDEFQDTSRAQWELVAQLVRSWGEGFGAAADALPPSIFIVGDRKQSIYGFRDADVACSTRRRASSAACATRRDPRRAISVSFRSAPRLLAFVNDLFAAIEKAPERPDGSGTARPIGFRCRMASRYRTPRWRVPATPAATTARSASSSATPSRTPPSAWPRRSRPPSARTVRDRATGVRRPAQAADVAILFRSRDSHREFEKALERRGVSTYVYKGLGFFDADEVQDGVALLRYLADPLSDLRAAAFLRSRLVRLSDAALASLAPDVAQALVAPEPPALRDAARRRRPARARTAAGIDPAVARVGRSADAVRTARRVLAETA